MVFRAVLGSGEGDWFSTLFTSVECVGSRGGNDLGSGDLSAPALGYGDGDLVVGLSGQVEEGVHSNIWCNSRSCAATVTTRVSMTTRHAS